MAAKHQQWVVANTERKRSEKLTQLAVGQCMEAQGQHWSISIALPTPHQVREPAQQHPARAGAVVGGAPESVLHTTTM